MATWWLASKIESTEYVYKALDVMKCDPIETDDFGKDVTIAWLKSQSRWDDEINGALPLEAIFFDGGGCVRVGEPKVTWEANGCKMKTRVTHLPFTLDAFKALKEHKHLKGCVSFGGFHRVYILSLKTIHDSIEVMERLLRGTESLRQELEIDMQKTMNQSEHAFSVRKCGCMSGNLYVECCGKAVESERHKEIRKAAMGS